MSTTKTILVTGASSGIGAAVVSRLAADGHRVIGTARQAGPKNPDGSPMLELDVTSDDSVRTCVARFLELTGRIDVLINNAGAVFDHRLQSTVIACRPRFWNQIMMSNISVGSNPGRATTDTDIR